MLHRRKKSTWTYTPAHTLEFETTTHRVQPFCVHRVMRGPHYANIQGSESQLHGRYVVRMQSVCGQYCMWSVNQINLFPRSTLTYLSSTSNYGVAHHCDEAINVYTQVSAVTKESPVWPGIEGDVPGMSRLQLLIAEVKIFEHFWALK